MEYLYHIKCLESLHNKNNMNRTNFLFSFPLFLFIFYLIKYVNYLFIYIIQLF